MRKLFSNVWFKCISVLLVIILVSGGLLSILNDVLYVSADERTGRAVKKIYGEEKAYTTVLDVDSTEEGVNNQKIEYEKGEITKVYLVDRSSDDDTEYDILLKTTGNEGFKFGTISLWVRVSVNGNSYQITKVVLDSFEKQTLMGKLGDEYYKAFENIDLSSENATADGNIVSGATKSSTAGDNAVNCVIKFVNEYFGG